MKKMRSNQNWLINKTYAAVLLAIGGIISTGVGAQTVCTPSGNGYRIGCVGPGSEVISAATLGSGMPGGLANVLFAGNGAQIEVGGGLNLSFNVIGATNGIFFAQNGGGIALPNGGNIQVTSTSALNTIHLFRATGADSSIDIQSMTAGLRLNGTGNTATLYAAAAENSARMRIQDSTLSVTGVNAQGAGLLANTGGSIVILNSTLNVNDSVSTPAIHAQAGSTITGLGATINFNNSHGASVLTAESGSFVGLDQLQINVTGTSDNITLTEIQGGSRATVSRITGVLSGGNNSTITHIQDTSQFSMFHSLMEVDGSGASALFLDGTTMPTMGNTATINDSQITVRLGGAGILLTPGSEGSVVLNRSTLRSDGLLAVLNPSSTLDLQANDSVLSGSTLFLPTGVLNMDLNNSVWNTGVGNRSNVTNLNLNNSTVNFGSATASPPGSYNILQIGTLSGSGQFNMRSNLGSGVHDTMNIANGNGAFNVDFLNYGDTPQDLSQKFAVIDAGASTASFSGKPVDVGAYEYHLVQDGNIYNLELLTTDNEEGLPTPILNDAAKEISLNTALATAIWANEMQTIQQRLGDLRLNPARSSGIWMRTYGNRFELDGRSDISILTGGFMAGFDRNITSSNGNWYVGVLAGAGYANTDFHQNDNGSAKIWQVGGYASYLANDDWYVDLVGKYNHINQNLNTHTTSGDLVQSDYDTGGYTFSVEAGKNFKLSNGWELEPQAEVMNIRVNGNNYQTSNLMDIENGAANSIHTRLSLQLARKLSYGNQVWRPYAKISAIRDFQKNFRVNVAGVDIYNNFSGNRAELTVGTSLLAASNLSLYGDFTTSRGSVINSPWGVNLGARFAW